METRQRPLTADEIEAVTDEIATEGEVAGLVALWGVLLGYPLANHTGPPFHPGSVAIPATQWKSIAAAMVAANTTSFPAGTMINNGPSSFETPDFNDPTSLPAI